MIVFLDTSEDLKLCEKELRVPTLQLFTPLTNFNAQYPEERFALDNGAFSQFRPEHFRALLRKHADRRHLCQFVACPDVVGSAIRTLECFAHWLPALHGWPVALVAQDGQEHLPIPWEHIHAVFIGGSTGWKIGDKARQVIKAAQVLGKWVHVGRVNTPDRFQYFEEMGVDSIDGTGLARWSHMRSAIADRENGLFAGVGSES